MEGGIIGECFVYWLSFISQVFFFKINITWAILKIKNTESKQEKKNHPGLYDSDPNYLIIWIHTPCPILCPVREPEPEYGHNLLGSWPRILTL